MRIVICDDDSNITILLSQMLTTYFSKKKIKCPELSIFNSGENLLADKEQKDIVFLDVEMPGFDGIYVGNELKKQNESVIIFIVTSYIEYLVQRFLNNWTFCAEYFYESATQKT
ncbi:MAG: response regulator [Agathobacter sp.]|nr:response regulator [Agathobacter sp.]